MITRSEVSTIFELFAGDAQRDVVHAGAAVFLRHRDAEQPELRHPAEDAVAIEVVLAIVVADEGRDFARAPLANRLLEQLVFVGQREINHGKRGIAITRGGRRARARRDRRSSASAALRAVGRDSR